MSRRGFVSGLTKAGLTMTAAQSVLGSVSFGQPGADRGAGRRRAGQCRRPPAAAGERGRRP